MQLKSILNVALALAGLQLLAPAMAAETISAGQRLAATCSGCHGTNGAGAGGALPRLAGQPKEALVRSLQAFKAATRESTIMRQIARGYTDQQIEQIAAYFAAQKK